MARVRNKRQKRRGGFNTISKAPFRDSSKSVPQPTKRDKLCYWEYGNDYNETTGRWMIYVDIISGNPDLIDCVGFRFSSSKETYTVHGRFPIMLSDGTTVHRLSLFGQNTFPTDNNRKISILLIGKSGRSTQRRVFRAKRKTIRSKSIAFYDSRGGSTRSQYLPALDINFGVEFEMSSSHETDRQQIKDHIESTTHIRVKLCNEWKEFKKQCDAWKIGPDSSLECNRSQPNCNKFELVSPILNAVTNNDGNKRRCGGLDDCKTILTSIKGGSHISLNKSMGTHVHVNVNNLNLEEIKNVCLNFIKYEKEIDTLMPPSRRANRNTHAKSNCDGIEKIYKYHSNGIKHKAIIDCTDIVELSDLMNPNQKRYYKLNLQNLKIHNKSGGKDGKTTLEFRQHSATCNYNKVNPWIRFCTRFVHNSAQRRPNCIDNDDSNDPFEFLFDTVIQDAKLKEYYRQRKLDVYDTDIKVGNDGYNAELLKQKLAQDTESDTNYGHRSSHRHGQCCDSCNEGRGCQQ